MKVLKETDYSKFKLITGNRPIDENRVIVIASSMAEFGFIESYHIVVNENMEVTDGQHRVRAAELADVEVYYVVDPNLDLHKVQRTGSLSKSWSWMDYLNSYASAGNENYIRIQNVLMDKDLKPAMAAQFVFQVLNSDTDVTREAFKAGKTIFTETSVARLNYLYKCVSAVFSHNPEFWKYQTALSTLLMIVSSPTYDPARMERKLKFQSTRLVRCATSREYTAMYENIYNFKSKESGKIKLRAKS